MQSSSVASTVRVGNHALTAQEAAAGQPERDPFVDDDGAPVDPDAVALALTAPTGQTRTFAWPTAGAASALPGVPAGYLTVVVNGTPVKLAYWSV